MNKKINDNLLFFYRGVEKLKTVLRNAHTSDSKRRESVAEHSWMMSLIALTLFENVKTKCNKEKVLKLIAVHDIAEAITGDIPTYEKSERKRKKHLLEKEAIIKLTEKLDKKTKRQIMLLCEEFEENKTMEAKIVHAIDKMEVIIQHLNAHIKTWNTYHFQFNPYYMNHYFDFDRFLRELKDTIDIAVLKKVEKAKLLDKIRVEHLKRYKESTMKRKYISNVIPS
jgi:putative hydrolase of HD superfamily